MKKYKLKTNFKDQRGIIKDIIQEDINSITYITIKKGKIRGNHYHKKTTQWNFIINGSVKLFYKKNVLSKTIKKVLLKKNDLAVCRPNEPHAFKSLKDCEIIVFTKGPRKGKEYETDTYRLTSPIVK
jgi:mannose-6-phosphate isomerase-like protein (cupin superfamily)